MNPDFINMASQSLKIGRRDLVEKDFLIHIMLSDLSRNQYFRNNLLFKGGTCLIKCYLGYFRFSEDMDFTWKDQSIFKGASQKEVRRRISTIIDNLGIVFEEIASKHGMDFKCRKEDRKYVELVGGDKSATFKIWYDSAVLGGRAFIKIQINFVDLILFTPKEKTLISLLGGLRSKEARNLKALFENEFRAYITKPKLATYDIREIFCEKARSILTRRGTKARDFLDMYLISKKFGLGLDEFKEETIAKIQFVLKMYERYRKNFEGKKRLLELGALFEWGNEKEMMIQKISEKEFYASLRKCEQSLRKIEEL